MCGQAESQTTETSGEVREYEVKFRVRTAEPFRASPPLRMLTTRATNESGGWAAGSWFIPDHAEIIDVTPEPDVEPGTVYRREIGPGFVWVKTERAGWVAVSVHDGEVVDGSVVDDYKARHPSQGYETLHSGKYREA